MIEHGSCRARRSVDDLKETVDFHQCGEGVLSLGDIDGDDAICRAFDGLRRLCFISRSRSLSLSKGRHDVNALINARSRIRIKPQQHQLFGVALIGRADFGHRLFAEAVSDNGQCRRPCNGLGIVDHDLGAFVLIQKLAAKGPSRAYEEVASHVERVGFVEADFQHVDPFGTEPLQRRLVEAVAIGREGDGVDFDAADACLFQQTQLAHQLIGLHFVAVPPPTHKGAV